MNKYLVPFLVAGFIYACGGSKKSMDSQMIGTTADVVRVVESRSEDRPFEDEIMGDGKPNTPDEKPKWSCGDSDGYIPYDKDSVFFETRIIRVNFHVMNNTKGDQNFKEGTGEAEKYLPKLLKNANERLRNNKKMNMPAGNETPCLFPRIQYRLVGQGSDDDGIYYHYDDELYYFLNKGRNRNNYNKEVIKKYAVNDDEVLNIFLTPHHPDSVASKTYKESNSGIALGTSVKIGAKWGDRERYWKYASLLNHEIGHVFSLRHSWIRNDGCDDTPQHNRNWQPASKFEDGVTTNNVMDYNGSQGAYSPCQIGRIHQVINNRSSDKRKLVEADWCNYDPTEQIIIESDVTFSGAKDLNKDLVIESGASLSINCRLSMAKSAKIIVKPGGHLSLNNCMLHNDCGDEWGGIELQENKKSKATISYSGDVRIENVASNSKS